MSDSSTETCDITEEPVAHEGNGKAQSTQGEPSDSKPRKFDKRVLSPELKAMQNIEGILYDLEPESRARVLSWAFDKFAARLVVTGGEG